MLKPQCPSSSYDNYVFFLILRSTKDPNQIMRWLRQHGILLAREVVALDPYQHPKGSRERFALWEKIAANLDGFHLTNQIKKWPNIDSKIPSVHAGKFSAHFGPVVC